VVTRRGPNRGSSRPHRTDGPASRPSPDGEPDLLGHVRDLLRDGDLFGVMMLASTIVAALEPGPASPFQDEQTDEDPTLEELVDSLIDVPGQETTAVLTALSGIATDEVLRRHVRRELDRRGGPLPAELHPVSVDRTAAASHVLGHAAIIVVGVRTAGGQPVTIVITVDHELGSMVVDGFAYPGRPEAAITRLSDDDDPDLTVADLAPADARARIAEAIETGRITYPPAETDTWPECRPLVEWVLRALPEGGVGHIRPELDEDQRQTIVRRFLGSTHGRQHDDPDGRSMLDTLLWYGCDYGTGDPLTWSPDAVAILLEDWLPRKVVAEPQYLDLAPAILRRFIRFAHEERGLPDRLTEDALEVVDALEPEYRRVIRTERPQGPAALLAAMGWPDDEAPAWTGPSEAPGSRAEPMLLDGGAGYRLALEGTLHQLVEAVGSEEALQELTTDPLPEEPFDWDPVPADVHDRVGEVLALLDRCADELFDGEFRTAARRLLADIVTADAGIFRRRGRADTAAAAIAWIVGKANDLFDPYGGGPSIGDLNDWFGLSSGPSQRAATLLAALGIAADAAQGIQLGTPRYLTSPHRRRILQRRDIAAAGLGRVDDTAMVEEVPAFDLGVDPTPPSPWREPEPVDVLAVAWFPSGAFEDAVRRWPELAARVGTRDYASYVRVVQGTLIDLARAHTHRPLLVTLDPDELPPMANASGLEVTDWRTRAALAASLAAAGHGLAWPPGRNDPCWCGSDRKYKRCCDTVPFDPTRRSTPTDAGGTTQAYELDITLVGVRPRIFRRLAIAADATFGDLHHAIQFACSWDDHHLFAFTTPTGAVIGGSPFESPFGDPRPDAADVPIASYFAQHDHCQYEYDFGDSWLHDIRVVGRIDEPVAYRQQLLDGARAFPPENCGGLPGYQACVEATTGGDDPDDRREWLGDWDPEHLDLTLLKRRFDR